MSVCVFAAYAHSPNCKLTSIRMRVYICQFGIFSFGLPQVGKLQCKCVCVCLCLCGIKRSKAHRIHAYIRKLFAVLWRHCEINHSLL